MPDIIFFFVNIFSVYTKLTKNNIREKPSAILSITDPAEALKRLRFFPNQKHLLPPLQVKRFLGILQDQTLNASLYQLFRFANILQKELLIDAIANQYKLNDRTIQTHRHIADDIGLLDISQFVYHLFNDRIQSDVFPDDAVNVTKQGMLLVRSEDLPLALFGTHQEPRLLKPVQFDPDRIGRLIKLPLQPTQIGVGVAVQKEAEQQLQAGFIGNKCI